MTTAQSVLAEDIRSGAEEERAQGSPCLQKIGSVILGISDVMADTIGRFEEIAARITQIILTKGSGDNQNLIIELQSFDRLQQEFTAITKALARCAAAGDDLSWTSDQDARLRSEVIAAISVSELRGRLLRRFESDTAIDLISSPDDEAIF